jgi:beta-galactosidase
MIILEAYSNCDTLELFLNGNSLGKKMLNMFDDHIYKWAVPFEDGELLARGTKNGKATEYVIKSAGTPAKIVATIPEKELRANTEDVAHIIIQLQDKNGNPVKHQEAKIKIAVDGPATLLGVDNGASDNIQKHDANSLYTSQGRGLGLIQAENKRGKVTITVSGNELISTTKSIQIK